MIRILFLLFSISMLFPINGFASVDDPDKNGTVIFEKVYLQSDRELYAPGDDIWFKVYLVNGFTNRLIPGYKNIYVQLVSSKGEIVDNRLLISRDGTSTGDFSISDSISEGSYFIRAYTRYLTNFGDESYFYKPIRIMIPRGMNGMTMAPREKVSEKIDVSFLPESGNFILGANNNIAFKIIDEWGRGMNGRGVVKDESGNVVTSFETEFMGMGTFELTPDKGKAYVATVEGYPEFAYTFDEPDKQGIQLSCEMGERGIFAILKRNPEVTEVSELLLRATHKNNVLMNVKVTLDEPEVETMLLKQMFPDGVSKITLLNQQEHVLAERLIFVGNEGATLEIQADKPEYGTRSKVVLAISPLLARNDVVDSALCVSVVHEDYIGASGIGQTIKSYLMLDSELKGTIDSPAWCFRDDDSISSARKLDLVMMINGWRSYYWEELETWQGKDLPGWDDLGISVRGKILQISDSKPANKTDVLLSQFAGGLDVREQKTNAEGEFLFERLIMVDSARIIIDAKAGKNKRFNIDFEQPEIFNVQVNRQMLKDYSLAEIPSGYFQTEFNRLKTEREFRISSENILIDEVEILGKRPVNDGHYRIYGEPDASFQITDEDMSYISVADYLDDKVAGLQVINQGEFGMPPEIRIRGASKNPLLMIDGVVTTDWDKIKEFPMGDIDKIEIIKSGYGNLIFGSEGGSGAISIFTKMRNLERERAKPIEGRITPYVKGFRQARQFYSPKYSSENVHDKHPDLRPALLWDPKVVVENGLAEIEFYTSDNPGKYVIVVEGLSKKGKACVGTGTFKVSGEQ